jgi:spore maturation protein CgeB
VRVLVLDSYYRAFWRTHYRERPGLADRSYAEQFRSLTSRLFGTSDAYSYNLRQLGHDVRELVVNCVPLQAAWAREYGIAGVRSLAARVPGLTLPAARALLPRVLVAQVDDFDPDVVYVQDVAGLWEGVRREVRRRGCLLVAQLASTAPRDDVLRDCDLVVTACPHWVDPLRARGIDCEYVPLAFDERVLDAVNLDGAREYPVTFVGTLRPDDYSRRAQATLEQACARLQVSVWGVGAETLPPGSPILRDYRGEAWGRDMYRVLGNSGITLNRHGDIAEGQAINMRLYEATGMGSVLLTEAAPNLPELFEPGREVIAYESPEDLVAQVERLLDDGDERRRIAEAGQRRTLSDHTYAKRMPHVVELLEAHLG